MILNEDNKAWQILTEEEKTALSLQYSYDKSTWQAGEIMGKAHYKYLEIVGRGKKFLQIFTEYFEVYPDFIPKYLKISPEFRTFLNHVFLDRYSVNKASSLVGDYRYENNKLRDDEINAQISILKNNLGVEYQLLLNLILDFDRWNNFRILPKNLQEPSAFKRRNKNRLKKQLKGAYCIPFFINSVLVKKYKENLSNYHIVIFWDNTNSYEILPIRYNENTHKEITELGFLIFESAPKAELLKKALEDFNVRGNKTCKKGQAFWPIYREILKTATNFESLENILPSRRFLDVFAKNTDAQTYKKYKNRANLEKAKK